MDCSMPGFPVHHHLWELAQTHVRWVGDATTISSSIVHFLSLVSNVQSHLNKKNKKIKKIKIKIKKK